MKKNLWIVFAAAISTSLLAQDASNSAPVLQAPPPEPAPITAPAPMAEPAPAMEAPTNAPAASPKKKAVKKKTVKKTVAHKPAPELKTVPLVPGSAVVSANHVNIRSKAGLVGEVLTHMTNGEPVTVIEEVHLKKSGPDEPSAWAKILLPSETHVWVKSSLLGADNTVSTKKVNLRAGPGENYGVLGTLQKGEVVQTIDTKGDWTQIQAPTNAYAFMAAQYLKQGEESVAMNTPPTMPAPETNTMAEMPTMAQPPTELPGVTDTNQQPMIAAQPGTEMPAAPAEPAQPPPPRIVEHEGIVRGAFSIQSPTRYELVSQDTKQAINYLYTTSTNLDLSRYKGMHIIVTGEESLDERWKNTPVITIQRIQVLD
ncbi:MAG TPA: SH3 domain-containing protein [Verrucomicrobiae bacterium]|jgi:uncharacterized protein YgiM (DUF1202 family)|nr:SH3 domain-containing protein [Verrucomicrobiae bacterium]